MDYQAQYRAELETAITRTEAAGYTISENIDKWINTVFVYNPNMTQKLLSLFKNRFVKNNGCYDLSMIKGRCFEIHKTMNYDLLIALKLPAVLTMGYVTKGGRDIFKFEDIESLPQQKTIEGKPSLNYHIWLTLPNCKILDFTFIAHFEYTNCDEYKRKLLANASDFVFSYGNADTIYKKEDTVYHPLYIGYEVIAKSILK